MGIADPTSPPAQTVDEGARQVRKIIGRVIDNMDGGLERIRDITAVHGRSALATALAPDGGDLLTVYNAIEAVLELPEIGMTIDPLP